MVGNAPNTAHPYERLEARAREATQVVERFFRNDHQRLVEAARRLPADEPNRPRVEHQPMPGPEEESSASIHSREEVLILSYEDGVKIVSRVRVTTYEIAPQDPPGSNAHIFTDNLLEYSSPLAFIKLSQLPAGSENTINKQIRLYDQDDHLDPAILTEPMVVAYEDLADHLRPVVEGALVG